MDELKPCPFCGADGRQQVITYEERQQVYTNALIAYGEEKQCIVAVEELSECAKEICKVLRGKRRSGASGGGNCGCENLYGADDLLLRLRGGC